MEMVSAKAILYNNKNTESLLEIHPDEQPVSLQFFGSDPKIMSEMAKRVEDANVKLDVKASYIGSKIFVTEKALHL